MANRQTIILNEVESTLIQGCRDKRSKKVVFLSHCLLNENTRYLGGACQSGCIKEIVDQCLKHDLGIVQMPCPEQRAWGGVLKRYLLMGHGLKLRYPLAYRLRGLLIPAGMLITRFVYSRLASEVVGQIEDYITSGFSVVGIIGIDGSPSCAVNRTPDYKKSNIFFSTPVELVTPDSQKASLQESLMAGRGIFVDELLKKLKRRGIEIPFQAHDLMAELDGKKSNVIF